MSIETVRRFFQERGREGDVLEFSVSSATVELAAAALGVIPARIAKSLTFAGENGCIMVVAAGDAKVDNAKFKRQFSCKAKMLPPDQVLSFTGHAVGGVCPFGIDSSKVTVYLDRSLQRFDTVFPAAGSSNSAIQLTCSELEEYAGSAGWVDVCKNWQEDV